MNLLTRHGNPASAEQTIIEYSDKIVFKSYSSIICEYNPTEKTLLLHADWDYSKTTLFYFRQFIKRFTVYDYETKAKFEKLIKKDDRITTSY